MLKLILKKLLSALLLCIVCTSSSFAEQNQKDLIMGLGDRPKDILQNSPQLSSYMEELKQYFDSLDVISDEEAKVWTYCEQTNFQSNEIYNCDELDSPTVNEPGAKISGALIYKDSDSNFRISNVQLIRLRFGDFDSDLFDIRVDLQPSYKNVKELVDHFGQFKTEVELAISEVDASNIQRLQDSSIKHNTKLDNHIFTLNDLLFDLKTAQLTDKHQRRCEANSEWLLKVWANEKIYVLLVLTGIGVDFDVIGSNHDTDYGYRLSFLIGRNTFNDTEKVSEAYWRTIFYPVDQLQLPLADRKECYK